MQGAFSSAHYSDIMVVQLYFCCFKDATAVITKKAAKLLEEIIQINQQATHVLEANTTSYHQRLRVSTLCL